MEWRVPLSDMAFGVEEEEAVLRVVKSRWLTMGSVTEQFEQAFAAYIRAKHAIAVTNETAALHLACLAAGLGPGDEAILPSLSFVATANSVSYTGAVPVFADVESRSNLNISPDAVEASITPRTRAILVVHYGGYSCDMPALLGIARRHGLYLIEDAAHAVGSRLGEQMLGTWGDIGCFSFFSNMNMTTGEGGMLVTDSPYLANKLRILRSHGMTGQTWDLQKGSSSSYDVVDQGYNYRIDEIRSSLGLAQLQKLEGYNLLRRMLTAQYHECLEQVCPAVELPFFEHPGLSACHLLPVLLPEGTDRQNVIERMKMHGVQTGVHYPPIHLFSAYKTNGARWSSRLAFTEALAERELTLPLYPSMTHREVSLVVDVLKSSLEESA